MNTGLQDAFNLGWKLALACQGMHQPALLDSYEAERRPIALRIVASGDAFEGNQAMTTPEERAERDVTMRQMLADSHAVHHEVVAAAELDRSYADSPLVQGEAGQFLGAGDLVPDGIPVETGVRRSGPCTNSPIALATRCSSSAARRRAPMSWTTRWTWFVRAWAVSG